MQVPNQFSDPIQNRQIYERFIASGNDAMIQIQGLRTLWGPCVTLPPGLISGGDLCKLTGYASWRGQLLPFVGNIWRLQYALIGQFSFWKAV